MALVGVIDHSRVKVGKNVKKVLIFHIRFYRIGRVYGCVCPVGGDTGLEIRGKWVSLTDVIPHVTGREQQNTVFTHLKENIIWNYWYLLWSWSYLWDLLLAKTIMALLLAALISAVMGKLFKTNLLIKACFCSSPQSPDRHTFNFHIDFDKLFTLHSIFFHLFLPIRPAFFHLKP